MKIIRAILGLPFYSLGCALALPGMMFVWVGEKVKGGKYLFIKTLSKKEEDNK